MSRGNREGDAPKLVFRTGSRRGQIISLESGELTIGRDERNDLVLEDEIVSSFHSRIVRDPNGQYWLEDRGSKNGTFLGGERIQRERLSDGDLFLICKQGPEVQYTEGEPTPPSFLSSATSTFVRTRSLGRTIQQFVPDRREAAVSASGVRQIIDATFERAAKRDQRILLFCGCAAFAVGAAIVLSILYVFGGGGAPAPPGYAGPPVVGATTPVSPVAPAMRIAPAPAPARVRLAPSLEAIYGSLYFTYDRHGKVGSVTVSNDGARPLVGARLHFEFEERFAHLLVEPFERDVPAIAPGDSVEVEISPKLSDQILSDANRRVGTRVSLTSGETELARAERAVVIYRRDVFNWEDPRRIAIFVDPDDPAVKELVRTVWSHRVRSGRQEFPPPAVAKAMALLTAVADLALAYEKDAQNPLAAAMDERANDRVNFPVETLLSGFGDCDDLSVLGCSLLEAVGIPSAFAVGNGHVLFLFDTGVEAAHLEETPFDRESVVLRGERVWLPVEATDLGRPGANFASAWSAAKRYRDAILSGEMRVIDVREAWEHYVPMNRPLDARGQETLRDRFAAWDTTPLRGELERGLETLRAHFRANLAGRLADLAASIEDSVARDRTAGVLYARSGLYADARRVFARALFGAEKIPPAAEIERALESWGEDRSADVRREEKAILLSDLAATLALGIENESDGTIAVRLTELAIATFPDEAEFERAELMLRLALIHRLRGDLAEETRWLGSALEIDASLRSTYDGMTVGDGSVSGPEAAVRRYLRRTVE